MDPYKESSVPRWMTRRSIGSRENDTGTVGIARSVAT